jgi:hypothetical protein
VTVLVGARDERRVLLRDVDDGGAHGRLSVEVNALELITAIEEDLRSSKG